MARRPKGNYEVSSVTMYCVTRWNQKKKIRTWRRIQLQFHTITMSNGRIQYERKAAGKLILKHTCRKAINSYYKKTS